jgi:hypothetical protein
MLEVLYFSTNKNSNYGDSGSMSSGSAPDEFNKGFFRTSFSVRSAEMSEITDFE